MGTKEINITYQYLVRPLGLISKNESFKDSVLGELDFIMAYVGDVDREEEYICPVFLLFSNKKEKLLSDFIEAEYLRKKSGKTGILVDDYDYPGYIVLVYEFPESYRADYNKITFGKYSKTSEWFKNCFAQKAKEGGHTRHYHMLYKPKEAIRAREVELDVMLEDDDELESIMNIDNTDKYLPNELLDIKEYT